MKAAFAGYTPAELHTYLSKRGFAPVCLPIVASTTRDGMRRFFTTDGRTSTDLADPRLAAEWVFRHEDGGLFRLFPHGHPSYGLGGVIGPSVRASLLAPGAEDLGLDGELHAWGVRRPLPCTARALPATPELEDEVEAALTLARESWTTIRHGPPPPALPFEDRAGLRITRTIVLDEDFEVVAKRVERLAALRGAFRIEKGASVRYFFAGALRAPCVAACSVDLGAHVLGIDPIGTTSSVERLQRFLRTLLADTRYQVFDDATGEDVTPTVVRCPSFLVGTTRVRPALFATA